MWPIVSVYCIRGGIVLWQVQLETMSLVPKHLQRRYTSKVYLLCFSRRTSHNNWLMLCNFVFILKHSWTNFQINELSWKRLSYKDASQTISILGYHISIPESLIFKCQKHLIASRFVMNISLSHIKYIYIYNVWHDTHVITSIKFQLKEKWWLTKTIAEMKSDTEQMMKME